MPRRNPAPCTCSVAQDPSHARALGCLGPTLVDALSGALNDLHLHLGLPDTASPDFYLLNVTDQTAELHCRRMSVQLQHILEGAVMALGRLFFGGEVELQPLRGKATDIPCAHEVCVGN